MNRAEVYTAIRSLIGNPGVDVVPDRILATPVDQALEELALDLGYSVPVDTGTALAEDTFEYILPENFVQMLRVEWNDKKLDENTTYAWNRDGLNWRNATSGNPTQYAILSRSIYVNPPPSDTAVTTDGTLTLIYMAASPGMSAAGVRGFTQTDYWLLAAKTAIGYMGVRPSDENTSRLNFLMSQYDKRLKQAQKLRESPSTEGPQTPSFFRRRLPAAR